MQSCAIKVITEYKKLHQILRSLRKKEKQQVRHIPGEFSDKIFDFIDKPVVQCHVPVVKNTFLDDVDKQIVTKKVDRNTSCTVSGTNFLYSFRFLKKWSI